MAGVRTVSLGGTEPFPTKYKAKKYKLHDHFITKKAFVDMMNNLPEKVSVGGGGGGGRDGWRGWRRREREMRARMKTGTGLQFSFG